MRFFGIIPNEATSGQLDEEARFRAKFIRMPADAEESLTTVFASDVEDFLQHEEKLFSPGYKRDRDEMLKIESFPFPETLLRVARDWEAWGGLQPEEIKPQEVKAIMGAEVRYSGRPQAGEEDESADIVVAAFKKLDKSRVLEGASKRLLQWDSGNTFVMREEPGLVIPEGLDAVYSEGDLYFKSYSRTNGFLDLTSYFREATDEDIDEMLQEGLLTYEGERSIYEVANHTCRRLVSALRLSEGAPESAQEVAKRGEEFGITINLGGYGDEQVILIPETSREFKQLLEFMLQRYYPGIFDGRLRRANSVEMVPRP